MKKSGLSLIAIISLATSLNAGTYGDTYDGGYIGGAETEIGAVVDVPEIVYEKDIEENDSGSFWSTEGAGFYVGLAYSYSSVTQDITVNDGFEDFFGTIDETGHGFTLLAGYDFNQYIGVEGRYLYLPGINSDYNLVSSLGNEIYTPSMGDVDLSNIAIYLKGSFPFNDSFSVYGLVGYGSTSWEVSSNSYYSDWETDSGFQWGLGAKYNFDEDISIFVDYTSIYSDEASGVNYLAWTTDSSLSSINVGVTYKF